MMFEISRAWEFIEMSDFLKVYFMKNKFYLVISIWGVTLLPTEKVENNIIEYYINIHENIRGYFF